MYAEALRARFSPLRARASARALAEGLEATGSRRREDTLRLATWRLEGGGSLQPDIMLAAATTAGGRHDFPLAERLARAAVNAGAGFEAGLLLGQVCWLQGRAAEAEDHLRTLGAEATDPQKALLASIRINVLDFGLKRADVALQVAEEAEATITDPACRDQVTAERARFLGRSKLRTAVALAEPLLRRVSGRALVTACFAAGTSMTYTGQTAGAIEATERGLATHLLLTGPPLPFGPYFHLVIRSAALLIAGHLAEARALAESEYDKAIKEESAEAQPWFSAMLAQIALNEGRVATAARQAGESAGGFRALGWAQWVRFALVMRAHALALLGDAEAARAALAELDALAVPPSELPGPEVLRARAWTEVAAGDIVEGRRRLHEAVAMARSGGAWAPSPPLSMTWPGSVERRRWPLACGSWPSLSRARWRRPAPLTQLPWLRQTRWAWRQPRRPLRLVGLFYLPPRLLPMQPWSGAGKKTRARAPQQTDAHGPLWLAVRGLTPPP